MLGFRHCRLLLATSRIRSAASSSLGGISSAAILKRLLFRGRHSLAIHSSIKNQVTQQFLPCRLRYLNFTPSKRGHAASIAAAADADQTTLDNNTPNRHQTRSKISQQLLLEEDFDKWNAILSSTNNDDEHFATLDAFLRDWDHFFDQQSDNGRLPPHATEDVKLFSNLCLRISSQPHSTMFGLKLRVVQKGLVALSRLAASSKLLDEQIQEDILNHAQGLFESMPSPTRNYRNRQANEIIDRRGLYRLLFSVYSRTFHPSAADRCNALLEKLLQEDDELSRPDGMPKDRPMNINEPHDKVRLLSQDAFHFVLRAIAKNGDQEMFQRVRARMNQFGWKDSALTYNCLLILFQTISNKAQASIDSDQSPHGHSVNREAVVAWEQLLQSYRLEPSPRLKPMTATLDKLIFLHKDDPSAALEILTDAISFIEDYPACQGLVDGHILHLVLQTLVKYNRINEANNIGRYMMKAYNEGDGALMPTTDHFILLIRAQFAAGDLVKAKECIDWMESSENCSVDTYNVYLLELLEHEDDPIEEMEAIFDRMNKSTPQQAVRPNMTTYHTLMNGLAKSQRPGYPHRVDEVFRLALSLVEGDKRRLSGEMYGIALNAWAGSGLSEAVDRCQEIFRDIPTPSLVHFNILLKAFALAGQPEESETLLRKMLSNPGIEPDNISFNTAILAWKNAGNSQRAMALLEVMVAIHLQNAAEGLEHSSVSPDRIAVNTVLWAEPERTLDAARAVWELIYDAGLEYRTDLITPILKALADVDDKEAAWELMQECTGSLNCHASPGTEMILTAIDSCCHIFDSDDSAATRLSRLFGFCCENGLLNTAILESFRSKLPPQIYLRLTLQDPNQRSKLQMLPEIWRNRK